MPNVNVVQPPRQRLEWDTRDTMNHRLWSDLMVAGPKAVDAASLAAHPSHGAETMKPLSARQDARVWGADAEGRSYFPSAAGSWQPERPALPAPSVFQNPALRGYDVENGDVARELRSAVKEDVRFLGEDLSARLAGRAFTNQWLPAAATQRIVRSQMEAVDRLRPEQDDIGRDYRSASGPTWRH
jgi:hypothetical protein